MDEAVTSFLSNYPELEYKDGRGIVRCLLSGHEMPCRLEVLQSYVRGQKFLKLKANTDFDFQSLQPFIIPSLYRKHQLFCALTNRYLNKRPEQVKAHVSGKKYSRALERYKSGEQQLFVEKGKKGRSSSGVGDGSLQLEAEDRGGLEEGAGEIWAPSSKEGSNGGGEMDVDSSETVGVVDTDAMAGATGLVDAVAETDGLIADTVTSKPGATRKRKRKEDETRGRKVKRKGHTRIPRASVKTKHSATRL